MEARAKLDIPEGTYVFSRLLRPDLRKWNAEPILAARRIAQERRDFRLIIQEPPPSRVNWIRRKLDSHVILLPFSTDVRALRQTYAATDCILNYSNVGETFGMTLVEAMGYGIPVIANSTPRIDNAQLEHIGNNVRGLATSGPASLYTAMCELMRNPGLGRELGRRGATYANTLFQESTVELRLRHFLARLGDAADPNEAPDTEIPAAEYVYSRNWENEFRNLEALMVHSKTAADHVLSTHATIVRYLDSIEYLRQKSYPERWHTIARRLGRLALALQVAKSRASSASRETMARTEGEYI